MPRVPTSCPSCGSALEVAKLVCRGCDLELQGEFHLPALLRLDPEELAFVEAFVRASGSLKAMAAMYGQSYPTIRNRLDHIIERLQTEPCATQDPRMAILDQVARGELNVQEAAQRLREIEP